MLKARKACKRDNGYLMLNSSQFVFPMIVMPDMFSRWMTVTLKGNWKSFGRMAYAKKKINTATSNSWGTWEGKHSRELTSKHGRGARHGHIFSAILSLIATVMPLNSLYGMGATSLGAASWLSHLEMLSKWQWRGPHT